MMNCSQCSAEITADADICPACGAPQECTPELIDRAKRGDQQAIASLYHRTYSSLYHLVKTLVKDEDMTLDIIQDSYLKIFRSLYRLKDPEKFQAWIHMLARNTAIDYLRRHKPVLFSDMALPPDALVNFEDRVPEDLPEVVIDRRETRRLMRKILDRLPKEQRLVITLFYFEQMSVKQIAEELGISENTVKSRLSYGRKKIEAHVRRLEEKGTKLYGLAPIPFLLLLYRSLRAEPVKSSRKVLKNVYEILFSGSQSSLYTAGSAAGGTAARVSFFSAAQSSLTAKVTAGVLLTSFIGGTAVGAIQADYQDTAFSGAYSGTTSHSVVTGNGRSTPAPAGEDDGMPWEDDPITTAAEELLQDDEAIAEQEQEQTVGQAAATEAPTSVPTQVPTQASTQSPTQAPTVSPTVVQSAGNASSESEQTSNSASNPLSTLGGFMRAMRNPTSYTGATGDFSMTFPEQWQSLGTTINDQVLEDEALGAYEELNFLYTGESGVRAELFTLRLVSAGVSVNDTSYMKIAGNDTFNVYRVSSGSSAAETYNRLSDTGKSAYDTLYGTIAEVLNSFRLT